jgi:hypothetical protein
LCFGGWRPLSVGVDHLASDVDTQHPQGRRIFIGKGADARPSPDRKLTDSVTDSSVTDFYLLSQNISVTEKVCDRMTVW